MAKGPLICIIDDDQNVRLAIEGLVNSLGMVPQTFSSAEEFLKSPHVAETSCLITDVQMSGMNGLDLQALLQSRNITIPVVYITAFPDARIQKRAETLGAVCFLSKPVEGQVLVHCIEKALASKPLE